ncbi:MAG: hypothetical protein NTW47_22605, partial [Proteobacteria bacterium]|nr:hypothetical protein [Pseudomonadota bacterium]
EDAVEGLQPLLGFLRVGIRNVLHIHGIAFVGFAASGFTGTCRLSPGACGAGFVRRNYNIGVK